MCGRVKECEIFALERSYSYLWPLKTKLWHEKDTIHTTYSGNDADLHVLENGEWQMENEKRF